MKNKHKNRKTCTASLYSPYSALFLYTSLETKYDLIYNFFLYNLIQVIK